MGDGGLGGGQMDRDGEGNGGERQETATRDANGKTQDRNENA